MNHDKLNPPVDGFISITGNSENDQLVVIF